AIHLESSRRTKLFVRIVCSAIPETLLESELFGHVKGAFTDARTEKLGLLQLASGGTVFLDEITEISLSTQVKLLSVLESRTFRRVGGTKDIPFTARVISATNENLAEAVREKRFREDLYYRLNVAQIFVPSLRERLKDLPSLAGQILNILSQEHRTPKKNLSQCALRVLQSHTWPGNVRELKNVLERAIVFCNGEEILSEDIELIEVCGSSGDRHYRFDLPSGGIRLSELERGLVIQALERTNGNQTRAASLLGLSRDQLIYRSKKYQLNGINQPDRPLLK
ncbi:MAG: sigma-54-dependent Fis family transcriptional regulator, partial [Planctomycetes bacterium]|nr:sigma-54-dependent Fis family transcriptional regulator [Planctomycetota bacterium]